MMTQSSNSTFSIVNENHTGAHQTMYRDLSDIYSLSQ